MARAALAAAIACLLGCGYDKPRLTGGDDIGGDDGGSGSGSGHADARIDAPPDAPPGPADLLSFTFVRAPATLSDLTHDVPAKHTAADTFDAALPFNTNVAQLVATFTTSGAQVTVGGIEQTSGTSINSFTAPVSYVVTSADGLTSRTYTISAHARTFSAGPFVTATTIMSGAQFLALADLDGDSWLDLLVAGNGGQVYRNKTASPGGTAALGTPVALGTTQHGSVITGDFNRDGSTPDIVMADAASIVYFRGTDATAYTAGASVPAGTNDLGVASADFDGDGKPDLAVMSAGDSKAYVLLNTTPSATSGATFATGVPFATGASPFTIASADLNGDGKFDLVTFNNTDATVLVNTSSAIGTASFSALPAITTVGGSPSGTVADVNGDGKPDLVAADYGGAVVTILLNTTATAGGTPTFAAAKTFPTGQMPWTVIAFDVDGDGRLDLVTPNQDPLLGANSNVSILINTTPPGSTALSFKTHKDIPTPNIDTIECVVAGDIDGDGAADLVAGGIARAQVFVAK